MNAPSWVTAVATMVIALATIVYVWINSKLWLATRDTARRTEELAKQSAAAFTLQFLATYMERIIPPPQPVAHGAIEIHAELWSRATVRQLLSTAFPEEFGRLDAILNPEARGKKE